MYLKKEELSFPFINYQVPSTRELSIPGHMYINNLLINI